MPNPRGNPGNKGGGRHPVVIELQDNLWHQQKWELDTVVKDLTDKLKSGTYSVRDVFLAKALQGNEKILGIFANKLLPDLYDVRGKDGGPLNVQAVAPSPEMDKLRKEYEDKLRQQIMGALSSVSIAVPVTPPTVTHTTSVPKV